MKLRTITLAVVALGDDVTLWYGGHGQGGIVQSFDDDTITLLSGTARIVNVMPREGITSISVEEPYDETECLDYADHDCSGPVEDWWSGGMNGRTWPRCTFHGERRLESYETSMERYADSDVAPDWFDPAYAGGRWEDDY